MPRNLTAGMAAAMAARSLRPAIFLEANFTSGPVRLWSGWGTVTWDGHSWTGIGALGNISPIEEGTTVDARGITLTLSGFDSDLLTHVMGEFQIGLPVRVWIGLFDDSGSLINSPFQSWAGRMDQPTVSVGGDTASIAINCESRLIDLQVAVDRRYTDQDQQIDHPGDRGFEYVSAIQERKIYWGTTANSTNNL